ncbi:MAG: C4-dicarboxylate ABC transporter [Gammaproteobacteria bacterium RIFOXYA12_FULL_61_12]|nr:MAG: C4-dicarboxylate ABC transporter [Gammaproteobacteria bacterium RIFOXYD12_FULL_61_37]OGT94645.1 MAG: C4-dicarboxylate ABC transporter [Gammaproteobacteria bacterium RIFOXYA12_FULL_61_12]
MSESNKLQFLPVSFFSMVMGLAGLTIAWRKMQDILQVDWGLDAVLGILSGGVFLTLSLLYLIKIGQHRAAVLAELRHPVKLNFFPTISISLILLSVIAFQFSFALANFLWTLGVILHLLLTHYVMYSWLHHEHYEIHHINPAWFIPVVGNAMVPIVGVPLGYGEISWFFFSIGIVFWLVLFVIIFYRVLFHNPLSDKLMPTFFILIAPPAVGFIAYEKLNGDIDNFARVLYYSGLFLTLLLLAQAPRFLKLPFSLTWWAYSFPIAAITIATFVMFQDTGIVLFQTIGMGLLTLLSLMVAYLLYRTIQAARKGLICQPD